METIVKKLYEAMFLVDSAEAAADWDAVITTIKNILEKAEAEIVSIKKWDERKLAYEINGKTKGTYILCYFRAEGGRIQDIERDVQLSERIMRVLILSAEHIKQEDIERDPIPAFAGTSLPLRKQGQKDRKRGTQKDTPVMRAEKHGQRISQAEAEKTEAKKVSAREAAKEAEQSEQAAKPVAYASEAEQPEKAERKDLGEAGETEKGD